MPGCWGLELTYHLAGMVLLALPLLLLTLALLHLVAHHTATG
jgi:hypothetical protein